MENETWKFIDGYGKRYKISTFGRVKSLPRIVKKNNRWGLAEIKLKEKILNPYIEKLGYCRRTLSDGKRERKHLVHMLVAKAFIDNPQNKPCINHINGIKTDNRIQNLEWCSYSENQIHAFRTGLRNQKGENHPNNKLNERKVKEIRSSKLSNSSLAVTYGVKYITIYKIRRRQLWKHI